MRRLLRTPGGPELHALRDLAQRLRPGARAVVPDAAHAAVVPARALLRLEQQPGPVLADADLAVAAVADGVGNGVGGADAGADARLDIIDRQLKPFPLYRDAYVCVVAAAHVVEKVGVYYLRMFS